MELRLGLFYGVRGGSSNGVLQVGLGLGISGGMGMILLMVFFRWVLLCFFWWDGC